MFKAIHKRDGFVITVYATKYDGDDDLSFLIYSDGWYWRKAYDYEPYGN